MPTYMEEEEADMHGREAATVEEETGMRAW
jgi:hypothetical protein